MHLVRPGPHSRKCIRHGEVAVVVAMDAHIATQHGFDLCHQLGHPLGHRAAVGVAQDHHAGTCFLGGLQRLQCVVRIGPVAIEEMLGIVHHLAALTFAIGHAVADHVQVFVERGADDVQHVEVPSLAHDGDNRRV